MKKETIEKVMSEVTRALCIVALTLVIIRMMLPIDNKVEEVKKVEHNSINVSTKAFRTENVNIQTLGVNKVDEFGVVKTYKDETVTDGDVTIILNKGDWYYELTDGSFGMYKNGKYYFQPLMLGDWIYELDSLEDLKNITETYISMNRYGYF